MMKVYHFLILIFSVICLANAKCNFKFKNNTATELEFGFKPPTNFKSINIKFPETPTSKLFECASKPDDSVTIDTKYKIGTSSFEIQFDYFIFQNLEFCNYLLDALNFGNLQKKNTEYNQTFYI